MHRSVTVARLHFAYIPFAWRWSFVIWIIYKFVITCLGIAIWRYDRILLAGAGNIYLGFGSIVDGWRGAFLEIWQRWDAIHYMRIVENGYTDFELSAFFPLFPLFGRIAGFFVNRDSLFSLLIISNLAVYFALVVLLKITEEQHSRSTAQKAVVCLLIFPASFFLFAPYAESLALLMSLITYRAVYHQRWLEATVFGILAGLSHPTVIPLTLALLWLNKRILLNTSLIKSFSTISASISPLLGVGLFLSWRVAQGFPSYSEVQYQVWSWVFSWPWQTILRIPAFLQSDPLVFIKWQNLFFASFAIGMSFFGLKLLPPAMRIYQISLLLFLLSTTREVEPLASWGRHSLLIFPLFIGTALTIRSYWGKLLAFGAGVSLQLFILVQFFLGGWSG